MIKQLSSTCYEWTGGGFEFNFLKESPVYDSRPPATVVNFPAVSAPDPTSERFSRAQIIPLQKIIDPILKKYGRFELCGSYRRGKPTVKDMDYIIETSREGFGNLRTELTQAGIEFHRGANEIMNGHLNGIAVDFFRCCPESYTSILIWRTGSARHNIYCATIARRRGMRVLRAGIERAGVVIHPKTEAEFYSILGVPYMRPDQRDMET